MAAIGDYKLKPPNFVSAFLPDTEGEAARASADNMGLTEQYTHTYRYTETYTHIQKYRDTHTHKHPHTK